MKKIIMWVFLLLLFPINFSYPLEDVKLKLPKGSIGEIYRAKAGHNYYTVVNVDGRERVMFANQYRLEEWSKPAGTIGTREGLEQSVKRGDVKKLREKSGNKVPDEVNVRADGSVEVISWQ
jgi:hypothetical protein